MTPWHLRQAVRVLRAGQVLAYPTEAVWGLGCDPACEPAIIELLRIKRRPAHKGLILIASDWQQLVPWLAEPAQPAVTRELWPGHVTCLLPAAEGVSPLLRGQHDKLAVRISAHPGVRALCRAFDGAIVSTSANLSGHPSPRSALAVRCQLGEDMPALLPGPLGRETRPSRIMDPYSGRTLRT